MLFVFDENMFSHCSKNELETVFNAIKKDEDAGLLVYGRDAMKVQIEQIQKKFGKGFGSTNAYNMAKEELYVEIAERYFKSDRS